MQYSCHFFFFLYGLATFQFYLINSQTTKWYYTRKFKNDVHPNQINLFQGSNFNYQDLFFNQTNDQPILFGGGMILLRENDLNSIFDQQTVHYLLQNTTLLPKETIGQQIIGDVFSVQYNLLIINNYENYPLITNISELAIMEEEIGLYDHSIGQFIDRQWRYTRLGMIVTIIVNVTNPLVSNNSYEQHKIISTADMAGKPTLLYHTWTIFTNHSSEVVSSSLDGTVSKLENIESHVEGSSLEKLRVMTYNLWHNNPPAWIYHVRKIRWDRYDRRIKLFAENIVNHDPDIVTLQEVRLDASFFSPIGRVYYEDITGEYSKFDGGSQVEHLLSHLRAAWRKIHGSEKYPNYQVVYHPAMLLKEREKLNIRNEEGLLILSKHPILTSEILLLSREVGSSSDDHQRIVLTAQIEVTNNRQESSVVTVATTHFSLSADARNRAVHEIKKFFSENDWINLSALQIFTGDLNAEPEEAAIQALSSESDNFRFVDTWTALHHEDHTGFTFPACNPVKRIDYIFAKKNNNLCDNNQPSCAASGVTIIDSFIIGQAPTEDTKHLVNSREGIGMNDADSPIWASDHFALVTDLAL